MTSPAPTGHERADKSVRVTRSVLFCGYNPHIPVQRKQRRLPHWSQPRATYFITFRLGDSIPANLQRQWVSEREIWLRLHPKPWNIETELEYHERFDVRMEEWLDRGFGQCHLRQPNFRVAVEKHLLHFDDQRYDIDAFVLMPNHVHVLLQIRENHELFDVLQGIKGTSARTCNKLLGRAGTAFWMEDSYNRIVRDAEELFAFRRYIAGNPSKAKLKDSESTLAMRDLLYVQ